MADPLNPEHYTNCSIEPMDVIEDWGLPHHLACVLKYIKRHTQKGDPLKDLAKAEWYLQRYINCLVEKEQRPAMSMGEAQRRYTKYVNDLLDHITGIPPCYEGRDPDAG